MSTPLAGRFQDHYVVLGISPEAEGEVIHKAYSAKAAKFHPTKGETPDKEKYDSVTQAFEVLSDPMARNVFDGLRAKDESEALTKFSGAEFFDSIAKENDRRDAVLCLLYDRRRLKPITPGIAIRQMEAMMYITADELQFTIWFLKKKLWVVSDDKSNIQISIDGMVYLEERAPDPARVLTMIRETPLEPTAPAGTAAKTTENPAVPTPVAEKPNPIPPRPPSLSLPMRKISVPPRS